MIEYETVKKKLVGGDSPVDIFTGWIELNPEATDQDKDNARKLIAFTWEECRTQSIKYRRRIANGD